jgi:tetratricopeptide (TPR) repeat protein
MKRAVRHHSGSWAFALLTAVTLSLAFPTDVPGQEASEKVMLRLLRHGSAPERREALHWLAGNGGQPSVGTIVKSLRDSDSGVRELAENALWSIWTRSGDTVTDEKLKVGTYLMVNGSVTESVEIFNQIISAHPEFAEGYNKRATAWYLLGAYDRSMADIRLTLDRNPHHFGALTGAGYCMLKMERMEEAAAYMERALKINPNMEGVRELLEETRKRMGRKAI